MAGTPFPINSDEIDPEQGDFILMQVDQSIRSSVQFLTMLSLKSHKDMKWVREELNLRIERAIKDFEADKARL